MKQRILYFVKENKEVLLILFFSFFILIAFFLNFFVVADSSQFEKSKSNNNNLTDKELKLLFEDVKFSSVGEEDYTYQSPVYNFEVTFNQFYYNHAEGNRGLSIFPKRNSNTTDSLVIKILKRDTDKPNLDNLVKKEKSLINYIKDSKIVSEFNVNINGIDFKKIIFTRELLDGKKQYNSLYLTQSPSFDYSINLFASTLEKLESSNLNETIESFNFIDSDEILNDAIYNSRLWGYKFRYNSKFWIVDDHENEFVNLVPRNNVSDEDKVDIFVRSSEVSRFDLLGREESFLDYYVNKDISEKKKDKKQYPNFQIVNKQEINFADRTAYVLEYKFASNSTGLQNIKAYYVLHYNTITNIEIFFADKGSEIFAQAENIFNTFEIEEPSVGIVKGISNNDNAFSGSNQLGDEKSVFYMMPAVRKIFSKACVKLILPEIKTKRKLSSNIYDICASDLSTGFFVNSDGYLATSGKSVIWDGSSVVLSSIKSGMAEDLIYDFFKLLFVNDPNLNLASRSKISKMTKKEVMGIIAKRPELLMIIAQAVENIIDSSTIELLSEEIYVQNFNISMTTSENNLKNKSEHLESEIVDYNFEVSDSIEGNKASNVALIKLKKKGKYPSLPLGEISDIDMNSDLLAIGCTGDSLESNLNSKLLVDDFLVDRVVVEDIDKIGGGASLVRVNSTIRNESKGAPVLSKDGKVVALSTYELSGSQISYLRGIDDLKALMNKNNVENKIGTSQEIWQRALDLFWDGKYSDSLNYFNSLNGDRDFGLVSNFIDVATKRVEENSLLNNVTGRKEDLNFWIGLSSLERMLLVEVTVLYILNFIFLIGLFISKFKLKTKSSLLPLF